MRGLGGLAFRSRPQLGSGGLLCTARHAPNVPTLDSTGHSNPPLWSGCNCSHGFFTVDTHWLNSLNMTTYPGHSKLLFMPWSSSLECPRQGHHQ